MSLGAASPLHCDLPHTFTSVRHRETCGPGCPDPALQPGRLCRAAPAGGGYRGGAPGTRRRLPGHPGCLPGTGWSPETAARWRGRRPRSPRRPRTRPRRGPRPICSCNSRPRSRRRKYVQSCSESDSTPGRAPPPPADAPPAVPRARARRAQGSTRHAAGSRTGRIRAAAPSAGRRGSCAWRAADPAFAPAAVPRSDNGWRCG